ncbi:hypothetical protein IW261DRAFT_1534239 [Armillaria novae-zelandiae]|uniref:Uncharacterized protein n=1 Tax=Armillaria novae-zelandiae TaxID=153914 RepID=A0AA39N7D0_9AGAR|nr:hypothetical protein IW261DRAFT_1534239 [Armillaria novae-zelandiae]
MIVSAKARLYLCFSLMHSIYTLQSEFHSNESTTNLSSHPKFIIQLPWLLLFFFYVGNSDADVEGQETVNISTQQIALLKPARQQLLEVRPHEYRAC